MTAACILFQYIASERFSICRNNKELWGCGVLVIYLHIITKTPTRPQEYVYVHVVGCGCGDFRSNRHAGLQISQVGLHNAP